MDVLPIDISCYQYRFKQNCQSLVQFLSFQNRIHTFSRLPQFFATEYKRERAGKELGSCKRTSVRRTQSDIIHLVYDQSYVISFHEQLIYVTIIGRIQLYAESVL